MQLIPKSDQPLTKWSGGTTRQIWIFPEGSSYAGRNFSIRLSTATVETESSTFTRLPGYYRELMVLEGELTLRHKDHHEKQLKKFDSDGFSGEWETTGDGKAVDFNAMSVEQYGITLYACCTGEALSKWLSKPGMVAHKTGVYVHKGALQLLIGERIETLGEGDFILLEEEECRNLVRVEHQNPVELVVVIIRQLF